MTGIAPQVDFTPLNFEHVSKHHWRPPIEYGGGVVNRIADELVFEQHLAALYERRKKMREAGKLPDHWMNQIVIV